jgi:hypothetical protein
MALSKRKYTFPVIYSPKRNLSPVCRIITYSSNYSCGRPEDCK